MTPRVLQSLYWKSNRPDSDTLKNLDYVPSQAVGDCERVLHTLSLSSSCFRNTKNSSRYRDDSRTVVCRRPRFIKGADRSRGLTAHILAPYAYTLTHVGRSLSRQVAVAS